MYNHITATDILETLSASRRQTSNLIPYRTVFDLASNAARFGREQ